MPTAIDLAEPQTTMSAEPIWVDPFICQYQMTDTSTCPEAIMNANRSSRWGQSGTMGGTNTYMRDSDQLHFLEASPPVEHEPILAFAQECLDHYVAEHKPANDVPPFGFAEGYNILRYKPGQAYHAVHADCGAGMMNHLVGRRHLTFVMYLNTITEGGETEFPKQGIKAQPVEGRAVIFPSTWTHAHRSLPAKVDRYLFNIFWGFPPQAVA